MSKGRIKEALISIGIGVVISLLSLGIEILKEVDLGIVSQGFSSFSGMVAYKLLKINYTA